jgi:hypothetical protein
LVNRLEITASPNHEITNQHYQRMLHITNGDSVIASFRAGSIPGVYLPWRDVLHDGPVPQTATLEELSDIRARQIAGSHLDEFEEIRASFAERDRTLAGFRSHDETVLWFEHDLYDQLQLLQLLDWFSRQDLARARLSIIQIGEHPELPDFHGLGELSGAQLAELLPARTPVSARQLELGRQAWEAFRAPDPIALENLAHHADAAMPFLQAALQRLLEEYPSTRNGLSRTEYQLLAAGAAGARHRHDFYLRSQQWKRSVDRPQRDEWQGDATPWGDSSVYDRLDRLASSHHPALDRLGDDEFAINHLGHRLLTGADDWIISNGIDVWLGGVHLTGAGGWRWDETRRTLQHGWAV